MLNVLFCAAEAVTETVAEAATKAVMNGCADIPSWIETVCSIVSALAAVVAAFSIGQMKKQNEISIFDKRYQVYCEFDKFIRFRDELADAKAKDNDLTREKVLACASDTLFRGISDYSPTEKLTRWQAETEIILRQSQFLFRWRKNDDYSSMNNNIKNMLTAVTAYLNLFIGEKNHTEQDCQKGLENLNESIQSVTPIVKSIKKNLKIVV